MYTDYVAENVNDVKRYPNFYYIQILETECPAISLVMIYMAIAIVNSKIYIQLR